MEATEEALGRAEKVLEAGGNYKEAAEAAGVSITALWRNCSYRKTKKRGWVVYAAIREWMAENDYEKEDIARILGLRPQSVYSYLKGAYKFPMKHKKKLAELIGGEVKEIFKEEEEIWIG